MTVRLAQTTASNYARFDRPVQPAAGLLLTVLILLFLSACAPNPMKVRQTVDDSLLEVVPGMKSAEFDDYEVKLLSEEDLTVYSSIMLTPITLRITEERWQSLSDQDKRRLYTDFTRAYRLVFDNVALTNRPDNRTLIIKTYVTELRPSDPGRNFAPFIIGKLDLGAAVFESEAVDLNGRLIAVARGVYNGRPLLEGYSTWDVVRHAVKAWMNNCKDLLQQAELVGASTGSLPPVGVD